MKKIKYIAPAIFKIIKKLEHDSHIDKKIYIYNRSSVITSIFINKRVFIYNGIIFIPVFIKQTMIGCKFGEFAYTRQKFVYKQTNKKKSGAKK